MPDPDGTARVIELDRTSPTRAHVVRLHPDGAIERGPALDEGDASPPTVLDDGTIVFVDRGRLRTVDRQFANALLADLLPIDPDDAWLHHARVASAGNMLITGVCERLPERTQPQYPGRVLVEQMVTVPGVLVLAMVRRWVPGRRAGSGLHSARCPSRAGTDALRAPKPGKLQCRIRGNATWR